MEIQQIGKRGILFTFFEPYKTNVFAIIGEKHTFICDTFLGPESMKSVIKYLKEQKKFLPTNIIIFNSHADYDHIWGNCFFSNKIIIAQENFEHVFRKKAQDELVKYKNYQKGKVSLVKPNLLFHSKLFFPEDQIIFFSSPGHTIESASCFDAQDKILFVGDNVEEPFPYINNLDIETYINTLEKYLSFDCKLIITGHDKVLKDKSLVKSNLDYLYSLKLGDVDIFKFTYSEKKIHRMNLQKILSLVSDEEKKEKKYQKFKRDLTTLSTQLKKENY
ncbi:MAG: MBL fold metallo-hydrolase [Candidatus Heimdallarchaeum endolithica]|uniref:MBL fold metallo-hydrolase n=1 Tax=Candidatus Heimdallarchaeum endolithica TaxID=2876572 RepID=A0A9Y1FN45_9ARCH|nr:MAG: MBL fold metallo-hydrolase [Candidatus Heimdallarchaeum endolithica]